MSNAVALENSNDRIELLIESMASYMALSTDKNGRGLLLFDNAVPFTGEAVETLTGEKVEATPIEDRIDVWTEMQKYPPPGDHLDFSWIGGILGTSPLFKWATHRIRRIDPKQARGVKRLYPYMARRDTALVKKDGTFQAGFHLLGWNGKQWNWCENAHLDSVVRSEVMLAGVGCMLQEVFADEWHVSLGFDSSPRIRFATSPEGVIEVFRLRDIPDGRARRTALTHWVREHWRRKQVDEDELVRVRRHLRGETKFTWNELRCEIHPAKRDLEFLRGGR